MIPPVKVPIESLAIGDLVMCRSHWWIVAARSDGAWGGDTIQLKALAGVESTKVDMVDHGRVLFAYPVWMRAQMEHDIVDLIRAKLRVEEAAKMLEQDG